MAAGFGAEWISPAAMPICSFSSAVTRAVAPFEVSPTALEPWHRSKRDGQVSG
jgi:hypothetical protein